ASLHDVFTNGFDYASRHRTKINFEAKLGRVLYDGSSRATKEMFWKEFAPTLDQYADRINVFFTDRVTTDFVDVDYITDRRLSSDVDIFTMDPSSVTVKYEFYCNYRGKPW